MKLEDPHRTDASVKKIPAFERNCSCGN